MTLSQTLIAAALSPALTLAASLRLLVPAYFYPGEDTGGGRRWPTPPRECR